MAGGRGIPAAARRISRIGVECPGGSGDRPPGCRSDLKGGHTVRAASYDRHGPAAEVLEVKDVERPAPGPGEVLVKVALSGINPTDLKSRSGATPRPIDGFQIPHHDGTGVIEAVGEDVSPARVGQRVWLWLAAAGRRWGTAAEW